MNIFGVITSVLSLASVAFANFDLGGNAYTPQCVEVPRNDDKYGVIITKGSLRISTGFMVSSRFVVTVASAYDDVNPKDCIINYNYQSAQNKVPVVRIMISPFFRPSLLTIDGGNNVAIVEAGLDLRTNNGYASITTFAPAVGSDVWTYSYSDTVQAKKCYTKVEDPDLCKLSYLQYAVVLGLDKICTTKTDISFSKEHRGAALYINDEAFAIHVMGQSGDMQVSQQLTQQNKDWILNTCKNY